MTSRTLAGGLLIPVTVVKTRYESGVFLYRSLGDAIRHTYRNEGIRGLTSGLAPTLMRDVPFSGLYYMFYTQLKAVSMPMLLEDAGKRRKMGKSKSVISTSVVTFLCGINAGLLASVVTQPMDVVSLTLLCSVIWSFIVFTRRSHVSKSVQISLSFTVLVTTVFVFGNMH